MKTVFPSNEIAHIWANQGQETGRCSANMRFDGPAFYSYGTVIARIIEHKGRKAYIVDAASFSSSTSRHQSFVRRAIADGETIFYVNQGKRGQYLDFTPAQLRDNYLARRKSPASARNAKSKYAHMRAQAILNRATALDDALSVCRFFGLVTKRLETIQANEAQSVADARVIVSAYDAKREEQRAARDATRQANERRRRENEIAGAIATAEKIAKGETELEDGNGYQFGYQDCLLESRPDLQQAIARARETLAEKKQAEKRADFEAWKQGATGFDTYSFHVFPTALRRIENEVETSLGAKVSIADAERGYKFAARMRERGWHANGEQFEVGMYRMRSINGNEIVIGCHHIAWEELERFAAQQNW